MTDLAFAETVRTATIHRADAPVGRLARFHLRHRFDAHSCCHRSWSGRGKRVFLHGGEREFAIEFACAETHPDTGAVLEASTLAEIRSALRRQFDHTTLIAADDWQRELFEMLSEQGAIDLRIMDSTGVEGSAAWVFDTVELIVAQATDGRVWVSRVEATENRDNVVTLMAD